jgi:hypothetical protein
MTESEKERMRAAERELQPIMEAFRDQGVPEEMVALMIGVPLASMDAWFAVRDGGEWRGMTDPKEIAARILCELHVSDEANPTNPN